MAGRRAAASFSTMRPTPRPGKPYARHRPRRGRQRRNGHRGRQCHRDAAGGHGRARSRIRAAGGRARGSWPPRSRTDPERAREQGPPGQPAEAARQAAVTPGPGRAAETPRPAAAEPGPRPGKPLAAAGDVNADADAGTPGGAHAARATAQANWRVTRVIARRSTRPRTQERRPAGAGQGLRSRGPAGHEHSGAVAGPGAGHHDPAMGYPAPPPAWASAGAGRPPPGPEPQIAPRPPRPGHAVPGAGG